MNCDYGSIRQVCGSSFVWHIPQFFGMIEEGKHYNIASPFFQYDGNPWRIRVRKHHTKSGGALRLYLARIGDTVSTQTYRLSVTDVDGEHYWPFPVIKDTFSSNVGTPQEQPESDLLKDASRRAPGGDLAVRLDMYPEEEERLPGVDILAAGCRPNTADCGTQTSPDQDLKLVPPGKSVLSGPNAISPAKSTPSTAECGTQTSPNGDQRERYVPSDAEDIENLGHNLKGLLLCGRKSDVTFVVQGRELKAHQNILVARSPVFSAMLNEEWLEQASGAVQITDCDAEVFQDFLLYLYSGKVETLEVKNVVQLFTIADKYDVKSLVKICVDFMILNLTVDSFCDFVPLASRHCELKLMASADSFFAENVKQIIATEKWKVFNAQNPNVATELLVKALCP